MAQTTPDRRGLRSSRSSRSIGGLAQPVQMEFIGKDDFFVLGEGDRAGQAGQGRRGHRRARSDGQLELRARPAGHRARQATSSSTARSTSTGARPRSRRTTRPATRCRCAATGSTASTGTGRALVYEKTLHRSRALQDDVTNRTNPAMPLYRGNHNGGVRARRTRTARSTCRSATPAGAGSCRTWSTGRSCSRPVTAEIGDDQFGGPDPDANHLTGVILRLNPDGTAPRDNPFYRLGAERGGSVGASLKKVYAYGLRNGFGMAFDPFSGDLWEQENGDDSFSEINRVEDGLQLRLGPGHGSARRASRSSRRSRRRASRSRRDPAAPARLLRPPADPLGPDQHRRHAA